MGYKISEDQRVFSTSYCKPGWILPLFYKGASRKSSGSDSGEQTPSNSQMRVELHQVSGIPPSEVPIHIQACDALLVTSTREGGPLVVKEALATGRPVVSTDVGDVAALLAGLPGCSIQDDPSQRSC